MATPTQLSDSQIKQVLDNAIAAYNSAPQSTNASATFNAAVAPYIYIQAPMNPSGAIMGFPKWLAYLFGKMSFCGFNGDTPMFVPPGTWCDAVIGKITGGVTPTLTLNNPTNNSNSNPNISGLPRWLFQGLHYCGLNALGGEVWLAKNVDCPPMKPIKPNAVILNNVKTNNPNPKPILSAPTSDSGTTLTATPTGLEVIHADGSKENLVFTQGTAFTNKSSS